MCIFAPCIDIVLWGVIWTRLGPFQKRQHTPPPAHCTQYPTPTETHMTGTGLREGGV